MVVVCLGLPGSGKSRFLGRLAWARIQAGRPVFVYCPHRSDAASHPEDVMQRAAWLGPHPIGASEDAHLTPMLVACDSVERIDRLAALAIARRPSVLWLDEVADLTVPSGRLWKSEKVKAIWAEFRHKGVEVWACAHAPTEIPRAVTRHAVATLIFRCASEPSDVRYLKGRYGEAVAAAAVALPFPTWHPICFGMPGAAGQLGLDKASEAR